jgi:hypothetical protein
VRYTLTYFVRKRSKFILYSIHSNKKNKYHWKAHDDNFFIENDISRREDTSKKKGKIR